MKYGAKRITTTFFLTSVILLLCSNVNVHVLALYDCMDCGGKPLPNPTLEVGNFYMCIDMKKSVNEAACKSLLSKYEDLCCNADPPETSSPTTAPTFSIGSATLVYTTGGGSGQYSDISFYILIGVVSLILLLIAILFYTISISTRTRKTTLHIEEQLELMERETMRIRKKTSYIEDKVLYNNRKKYHNSSSSKFNNNTYNNNTHNYNSYSAATNSYAEFVNGNSGSNKRPTLIHDNSDHGIGSKTGEQVIATKDEFKDDEMSTLSGRFMGVSSVGAISGENDSIDESDKKIAAGAVITTTNDDSGNNNNNNNNGNLEILIETKESYET